MINFAFLYIIWSKQLTPYALVVINLYHLVSRYMISFEKYNKKKTWDMSMSLATK